MYRSDKAINQNDRKRALKNYYKSDLIYNANHSFYKYHDIKNFGKLSLESRYAFVANYEMI